MGIPLWTSDMAQGMGMRTSPVRPYEWPVENLDIDAYTKGIEAGKAVPSDFSALMQGIEKGTDIYQAQQLKAAQIEEARTAALERQQLMTQRKQQIEAAQIKLAEELKQRQRDEALRRDLNSNDPAVVERAIMSPIYNDVWDRQQSFKWEDAATQAAANGMISPERLAAAKGRSLMSDEVTNLRKRQQEVEKDYEVAHGNLLGDPGIITAYTKNQDIYSSTSEIGDAYADNKLILIPSGTYSKDPATGRVLLDKNKPKENQVDTSTTKTWDLVVNPENPGAENPNAGRFLYEGVNEDTAKTLKAYTSAKTQQRTIGMNRTSQIERVKKAIERLNVERGGTQTPSISSSPQFPRPMQQEQTTQEPRVSISEKEKPTPLSDFEKALQGTDIYKTTPEQERVFHENVANNTAAAMGIPKELRMDESVRSDVHEIMGLSIKQKTLDPKSTEFQATIGRLDELRGNISQKILDAEITEAKRSFQIKRFNSKTGKYFQEENRVAENSTVQRHNNKVQQRWDAIIRDRERYGLDKWNMAELALKFSKADLVKAQDFEHLYKLENEERIFSRVNAVLEKLGAQIEQKQMQGTQNGAQSALNVIKTFPK